MAAADGGTMTRTRTRRIILIIVLAFVIYAIYHDPNTSAGHVRDFFVLVGNAVRAVFNFFDGILQ